MVDAQQPACGADAAHLPGEREKTKPAAVDHVIIGQGGVLERWWNTQRMASPLLPGKTSRCRVYSGRGHSKPLWNRLELNYERQRSHLFVGLARSRSIGAPGR